MNRYDDFIRDVLITLHMNIKELHERKAFADPEEINHIEGKLLAYNEVLGILRGSAEEFGVSKDELGL